ncbi:hypothetical protein [Streptomyces cavernicola]|uniref:Uncharacterized protein n=1 Tax=Streptomyces cavernicola TaxID=3043613 RepID=A0ABT6SFI2_9ACTN|nr:hypothetical protein [Streptomyces sp. B-S-A6]MDI3406046.1 hypothetical protein [Streptomyces sp. B-S-A6]
MFGRNKKITNDAEAREVERRQADDIRAAHRATKWGLRSAADFRKKVTDADQQLSDWSAEKRKQQKAEREQQRLAQWCADEDRRLREWVAADTYEARKQARRW